MFFVQGRTYRPHCRDTEAQRGSVTLSKVTQLGKGKEGTRTYLVLSLALEVWESLLSGSLRFSTWSRLPCRPLSVCLSVSRSLGA